MKTGVIYVANNLFETLLAISNEEQERGLMHIKPPVPVMTFVYDRPKINKFWMANTPSSLDILFCHNGKVTQICKGEPYSTSTIGDNKFSDMVIELPYGTVLDSKIKLGHEVGFIEPSDQELKNIASFKNKNIF